MGLRPYMKPHPSLLTFLSAIWLAFPASAQIIGGDQKTLQVIDGPMNNAQFGKVMASAGDVNADGTPDYIIGAPQNTPNSIDRAGSALVYSGATGTLLYQVDGTSVLEGFATSVSGAGDVNGDGFDDFLVGSPGFHHPGFAPLGAVYVYSGQDGSLLIRHEGLGGVRFFGNSAAGIGDINGDGLDDVLVGSEDSGSIGANQHGRVYVFSGDTSTVLLEISGTQPFQRLGRSVSHAGDLDADGVPDFLVGGIKDINFTGEARAYSGATGLLLYAYDGEASGDNFGASLSGAGDVNADGHADFLVGAPHADFGGQTGSGSAYLYSGWDGSLIRRLDGFAAYDGLGSAVSQAGDLDGDGRDDYLIGAPNEKVNGMLGAGRAYVFSGATGNQLLVTEGQDVSDAMGESVAGLGDVDGDFIPDVAAGAWHVSFGGSFLVGKVTIFGVDPYLTLSTRSISVSQGGTADVYLDFPTSKAGTNYRVLVSKAGTGPVLFGVDIPLTQDLTFNHSSQGNYSFPHRNLGGILDGNGDGHGRIQIPAGYFSGGAGTKLWMAGVAFQAGFLPEISSVAIAVELTP